MTTTTTTTTTSPAPNSARRPPAPRTATVGDLPAVEALLAAAGLPTGDVAALFAAHADDFLVVDDPDRADALVGTAGLEVCRGEAAHPTALLRSVAVRDDWRGHGIGGELVRRLVGMAGDRGLHALYLLTITAEDYFPRFAFAPVARDAVPPEIAATFEFRSACPASAIAMTKPLVGANA